MVTVPVVAPVVTHSFMTTASGCIVEDGRLRGVDIKTVPMPLKIGSTNDCCESCRMHLRMHLEACSLWTYDKVKKQCWLKSKAEPVTEADRAVRNWLFGNMSNQLLKPGGLTTSVRVPVSGAPLAGVRADSKASAASTNATNKAPSKAPMCASIIGITLGLGHDLTNGKASNQGECCSQCQAHKQKCKSWTFHPSTETCWLHNALGPSQREGGDDTISGVPSGKMPPIPGMTKALATAPIVATTKAPTRAPTVATIKSPSKAQAAGTVGAMTFDNADEEAIARWSDRTGKKPRVAVCLAGRWTSDFEHKSWTSIRKNVVDPLDADIFAVSDADPGGPYPLLSLVPVPAVCFQHPHRGKLDIGQIAWELISTH